MRRVSPPICPVRDYALKVLAGEIVSGGLVRLACERHLRDLENGHLRGLKFDHEAAGRALKFFGWLRLPEGDRPFVLSPFQVFIIGSIFGWKGPDGYRRFRTAYIESGKGSGKTPLAAGIGLFGLVADNELSAEIYTAGVTRDQAGYLLNDATRLADTSPALKKRIDIGAHNLAVLSTRSFMRPVSSEGRTLDQKRVHMALVDEVHEHPTSVVVDKMRAGTKGRNQALIFEITNSGHDRTTVCWQHHEYSEKVLKGIVDDDSWFAYICTLDPCQKCAEEGKSQPSDGCTDCDDWRDEAVWVKANPNLDVSVTRKYLREQVREAEGMPAHANLVKRLNFCIWTQQANRVIPMDRWDACARKVEIESLRGRVCFGGLDIGATSDFTAFALVFPHDDSEPIEVPVDFLDPKAGTQFITRRSFTWLSWFWLPEHPVKRDKQMQDVIDLWRKQGLIRTTPGNTVDYEQVVEEIVALVKPYKLGKLALDRAFQGSQTGTNLMKHFGDLVEQFPQGIISMNAPFREMMELLKVGRLYHDGNAVLRWMASNVAAEEKGGLVKPSKDRSHEKIDGITAGTMALGVAISEPVRISPYEFRGVLQVGVDQYATPVGPMPAARSTWREL